MTKEETVLNYEKYIAPKYPNGTGKHIAVLVKFFQSPRKFFYGIRFEVAPVVGEIRNGDRIKFQIEQILGVN